MQSAPKLLFKVQSHPHPEKGRDVTLQSEISDYTGWWHITSPFSHTLLQLLLLINQNIHTVSDEERWPLNSETGNTSFNLPAYSLQLTTAVRESNTLMVTLHLVLFFCGLIHPHCVLMMLNYTLAAPADNCHCDAEEDEQTWRFSETESGWTKNVGFMLWVQIWLSPDSQKDCWVLMNSWTQRC